jgi:hypothetical protein
MPPLSRDERETFLNTHGILCRIATVQAHGAPHVTLAWYI